jgi:tRNA (guanine37-N1)-methyltransferase
MTPNRTPLHFTVLTLFPELVQNYFRDALLSKAIQKNLININVIDLRNFSENNYRSIDDIPFGGGDGMVFKASVLEKALQSIVTEKPYHPKVVYLSPQGKTWDYRQAQSEAQAPNQNIILICGRYAGIDQRFIQKHVDAEVSIGDYVLSGGELAALVMIESISRFVPGVLGDELSSTDDSFENSFLEAPQFTKPQVWSDLAVPKVLTSGHHQKITEWKTYCGLLVTLKKRPDLFQKNFQLSKVKWTDLKSFYEKMDSEEKKILQIENLNFEGLNK